MSAGMEPGPFRVDGRQEVVVRVPDARTVLRVLRGYQRFGIPYEVYLLALALLTTMMTVGGRPLMPLSTLLLAGVFTYQAIDARAARMAWLASGVAAGFSMSLTPEGLLYRGEPTFVLYPYASVTRTVRVPGYVIVDLGRHGVLVLEDVGGLHEALSALTSQRWSTRERTLSVLAVLFLGVCLAVIAVAHVMRTSGTVV